MAVKLKMAGMRMTLIALQNSSVKVRDAARPAVTAAGKAYQSQVRRRTRLRDHTLAQLAAMDHPYAKRHGSIRVHTKKPWQVHRQSGRALDALEGRPITVNGEPGYEVTYDYDRVPYMEDVIQGTKIMLKRDVLWRTALDPATQKPMMKRVVRTLGKELRTQLGVRFGGGAPKSVPGAGGSAETVS